MPDGTPHLHREETESSRLPGSKGTTVTGFARDKRNVLCQMEDIVNLIHPEKSY